MHAIRFEASGDPSVLKAVEVLAPIADEKTTVVRVMAASINPSDVKNVTGAISQTKAPRIPGRDFAGLVQAGRPTGSAPKTASAGFLDALIPEFLAGDSAPRRSKGPAGSARRKRLIARSRRARRAASCRGRRNREAVMIGTRLPRHGSHCRRGLRPCPSAVPGPLR